MKVGVFEIKRVTQNHISGHRRSEKITRHLVKEISVDREAQISQQEVLTVNTSSPGVVSDRTHVVVARLIVSRKKSDNEYVCPKISFLWRCRCGDDFLRTGDGLPGGS